MSRVLQPYTFDACSIAPEGSGAITGLHVTSSVSPLSTDTLYFTTSTAVYRAFLQETNLQTLEGVEGTSDNGQAASSICGRQKSRLR